MARQRRARHKPDDESDGPQRLCAQTRTERAAHELIRFVAAPDGQIVPDLSHRLPGRGVWLLCDRDVVTAAVRANVFAKSLKRSVNVAPDMAETIGRLLAKRARDALALANKAGLVTSGFAQIDALLGEAKAAALVHAQEASAGGQEKLDRKYFASTRNTGHTARIITCLSTEELSLALGRTNVIHAALTQGGATERFLDEAERLKRYRSGSAASGSAQRQESEV